MLLGLAEPGCGSGLHGLSPQACPGAVPKKGAYELNTEYLGLQDPVENSPFS